MKIKVTEIECSAEELRQSNTLAESFTTMLRSAFNGVILEREEDDTEDED